MTHDFYLKYKYIKSSVSIHDFLNNLLVGGWRVSFMAYRCPTSVKILFVSHKRVSKIFFRIFFLFFIFFLKTFFRIDVSPIVQFFVVASSVMGRLLGVFAFFTVFVRSIWHTYSHGSFVQVPHYTEEIWSSVEFILFIALSAFPKLDFNRYMAPTRR